MGNSYSIFSFAPVLLAAETGDIQMVQLLLGHKADLNTSALDVLRPIKITESGDSEGHINFNDMFEWPEHGTEILRLYPLQAAASLEDSNIATLLLQHGATMNPQYGTTPLACAAYHSNYDAIRLFLALRADANESSEYKWGVSALEAAVMAENLETIKTLLEAGADINLCSLGPGGRTPLQRAAEIGNQTVIHYWLEAGAEINAPCAKTYGASALQGFIEHHDVEHIAKAFSEGASPNDVSTIERSPLTAAVAN